MLPDDLVMLAEVEEALQHKFQELNDKLNEWGTKANWQKTRVMRIGRKQEVSIYIYVYVEVDGERVELVN